jgi:6-phosphogluconate dehydrogenase
VIVDGGNSNYQDTDPPRRGVRRARRAPRRRRHERRRVGAAGGVRADGRRRAEPVARLRPVFETLAPAADRGWAHVGPPGAGTS